MRGGIVVNKTGIIILNYNSNSDLHIAVESIRQYVNEDYLIYIVDNCSSKKNIEDLYKAYNESEDVKILVMEENRGYSGGNNAGILQALNDGMEYILIMNPDVVLCNDIVKVFRESVSENIVCVGPKIIDIDGKDGQRLRKNYSFRYALFNKKPLYYFRNFFKGDITYRYNVEEAFDFVGSLSGCCFFMPANIYSEMDFFDDNVFLYCEEYIIGKKLEQLGYRCRYQPQAVIRHKEGTSCRKVSNSFIDYHMYLSEYYLLVRYCNLGTFGTLFIKQYRKMLYFLKTLFVYKDWERYNNYKVKMHQIDMGNYKIHY